MTENEWQEMIDLYLDNALPETLRARVEAHFSAEPAAARDAQSMQETLEFLRDAPAARPDPWYVEHALAGLLRDHDDASSDAFLINEPNR